MSEAEERPSLVDPGCAAIVRSFKRRTPRRPPASPSAGKDPMFRRSGSSFDLKSIREYAPGDDPRRIDWNLMGRCGRPFVKDYYEEERDGVCLLIDISGSIEAFGEAEAVAISASIAWILGALGLPTSLWAFSQGVARRRERPRGGSSLTEISGFFAGLRAQGRTDIAAALGAARAGTRYKRAVLVSDFLDPGFKPSASPFSRSYFLRLHRDFESLGQGESEVEVTDPESGERLRMPWDAPARERYRAAERRLDAALGGAEGGSRSGGGGRRSAGPGRGSWYRRILPDQDRMALYWELLEALYA